MQRAGFGKGRSRPRSSGCGCKHAPSPGSSPLRWSNLFGASGARWTCC